MNRLKQSWQRWAERIDAMALRERVVVFFALCLIGVFLFLKLVSGPVTKQQHDVSRQLAQKQVDNRLLQDQVQKFVSAGTQDPDAERRARVETLKNRVAQLDTRLAAKQRELVPPDQVPGLLEEMLRRDRKLDLVALRSLTPVPLFEDAKLSAETTAPNVRLQVYRHGVDLTVRGNYFDLLNYLGELEKLPLRMFWREVEISSDDYPVITMKLSVFTLSLDRSWVVV